MIRIRLYLILAYICLWPVWAMGQEADFEIRNFRERTTDLSAISSNYKDLNGKPAALIRITIRDPQFEFSANLGVIAQEKKTGEVYLYVPQDTKRLTVRHPRLGVLKDYAIPVKIVSKVTYDADIVIKGSAQPMVENRGDGNHGETHGDNSLDRDAAQDQEPVPVNSDQESVPVILEEPHRTTQPSNFDQDFHFYAGIGFNAVSLMGPSVQLGFSYGMFYLEGGFIYGLDKVEEVCFAPQNSSTPSEAYDYSCSKAWARIGVNFDMEKFRISPQAGATFNMISGKTVSGITNRSNNFEEAYPMSISAAVRLSYEVANHLRIHLTPQYDFSLKGDQIFEFIKQADSKLEAWGEGFSINAGIIYEF